MAAAGQANGYRDQQVRLTCPTCGHVFLAWRSWWMRRMLQRLDPLRCSGCRCGPTGRHP